MKNSKKGNITVEMLGRLGNQMFEYAFARALQMKFYPNYDINMSYNRFTCESEQRINEGFTNTLKSLNVVNFTEINRPFKESLSFAQKIPYFFIRCYRELMRRVFRINPVKSFLMLCNLDGIYFTPSQQPYSYQTPLSSLSTNITCVGYFQAHQYFANIRDILLKDFTPKNEPLSCNEALLKELQNCESVCVSVRRGDYLQYERFNICNNDYFTKAMTEIRKEIPNCKFYVFSNDIADVKRHFTFPYEVTYESEENPVWETLRLMYNCKNFIISNSSFHWWGQYLSRNPNKIVYAPSPWCRGEDCSGMYMPYMRVLKVSDK